MEVEDPKREDVYDIGTVAVIMRMLKLPDGRIRILAQGLVRARVESLEEDGPFMQARIAVIQEAASVEKSLEVEALVRNVRSGLEKATALGKSIQPEILVIAANLDDPGRLADLTASNLELKVIGFPRLRDFMQHALHGVGNRFFIRLVGQQQYEFIATLARHSIAFTQAGGQALRGDLEQFIADLVAQAVIDEFELIQVEEGNCRQLAVTFGMQHRLLHAVVEQGAIRQNRSAHRAFAWNWISASCNLRSVMASTVPSKNSKVPSLL